MSYFFFVEHRYFDHFTDRGNSRQIAAISRQFTIEFWTHLMFFLKKKTAHTQNISECTSVFWEKWDVSDIKIPQVKPFLVVILHG